MAVVLLALLGLACDSERRAISRDDLPEVPSEPALVVEIGDGGFDPGSIEVSPSDLVEFRNVDDAPHGIRTDNRDIDTGPLLPGESTHVVFDRPGETLVIDTEDATHTMSVSVEDTTPGS